jgi:hypothetical protein
VTTKLKPGSGVTVYVDVGFGSGVCVRVGANVFEEDAVWNGDGETEGVTA